MHQEKCVHIFCIAFLKALYSILYLIFCSEIEEIAEKNSDEHLPKNLEQKKLLMTIQWHSEEEFSHNKNGNLAILNDVTNPAHLICGVECS